MGQKRAFKRFRVVPLLVAGCIGYVLGGWNVTALRSTALSASQAVALRFPENRDDAQAVDALPDAAPTSVAAREARAAPAAPTLPASGMMMGGAQFALLSPQPMVPLSSDPQDALQTASGEDAGGSAPDASTEQDSAQTANGDNTAPALTVSRPEDSVQTASAKDTVSATVPDAALPQPPARDPRERRPAQAARETKPVATLMHRRADRPAYMLDDAQIASIKRRLHLTPDQERMWPAVEAALRNLAYSSAREARRRGTSPGDAQFAAADPNSAEVQGLKSAAIPLIMSFNDEQKDEVRNLAHVMGLDQLASQF